MKISVFGANGKVGSLVVDELLRNNFQVVAFCYGKTSFRPNNNLTVIRGNVYNRQDVDRAIKGSEAVISTLGSWGSKNKDILSEGMKNIVAIMDHYRIKRIVSLTGADAHIEGEYLKTHDKLMRVFIKLFAKKILIDGEIHIEILKNSDLNWTVLRSPVMNNKGNPKEFILSNKKTKPWNSVNRASVALCLIELLSENKCIKQAPFIKRA